MRIAALTSSRSDYGIYLPLLKKIKADSFFDLQLIVFGTHLSSEHGHTIDQITEDGFKIDHKLMTMPGGDAPEDISESIGRTIIQFSSFWKQQKNNFDLVFCLGDRYEMFAAVSASLPFNIKFAHLHGGESTIGAIDDKFRHSLSVMSQYHFVSTDFYAERVQQITGQVKNIHTVGALSLDNLKEIKIFSVDAFKKKHGVDMSKKTVLVTFHPETVSYDKNSHYADELISVMSELNEQIIITMPNADTMGNLVREKLKKFIDANKKRVFGFESLGTISYFSCMSHCVFLLGNTSSGIIEAASFAKYVVNLGTRQKGRLSGKNVLHCPIEKNAIKQTISKIQSMPELGNENIYGDGNTADKIILILKNSFAN